MGVSIQKTAAATAAKSPEVKTKPTLKAKGTVHVLAEELIGLHQRLTEVNAFQMTKRMDEIKKILSQEIRESGADPSAPYVLVTESGEIEYSPCSMTTEITDKDKLIKLLSPDVFKALAKIGVTDLRAYLSGAEIESVSQKVWGSRSMKAVRPAK